jgi:hypothetical protein
MTSVPFPGSVVALKVGMNWTDPALVGAGEVVLGPLGPSPLSLPQSRMRPDLRFRPSTSRLSKKGAG